MLDVTMPLEAATMPDPGDDLISRVVGGADRTWFYLLPPRKRTSPSLASDACCRRDREPPSVVHWLLQLIEDPRTCCVEDLLPSRRATRRRFVP